MTIHSFSYNLILIFEKVKETRFKSESDFKFGLSPSPLREGGFVMSSTVEGVGKCSKPEVEVRVQNVTCTEDAVVFVALTATMDLNKDVCLSLSQKLRKELRRKLRTSLIKGGFCRFS
ncbi:hypothetical protein V6N13_031132 [Hibiscus sabdariffa]|uniref:Uncharacterized protein n=1 Tax=Hibiscus sabdariffa TaxID=183260 RepID=A0ABR2CM07_9ROSI